MDSYILNFAGWTCAGVDLDAMVSGFSFILPVIILALSVSFFFKPFRESTFKSGWFIPISVLLMIAPPIGVAGTYYLTRLTDGLECSAMTVTQISTYSSSLYSESLTFHRQKILIYVLIWLLSVLVLTALILLRYNYQKTQQALYQSYINDQHP